MNKLPSKETNNAFIESCEHCMVNGVPIGCEYCEDITLTLPKLQEALDFCKEDK